MARIRRGRAPWSAERLALEQPAHADSVAAWINRYIEQQRVLGLREHSLTRASGDLMRFNAWCVERHIDSPRELTVPILERYRRHLFYYRKADGAPLAPSSQVRELARIKHWCRWLVRQGHLPSNPAADLELPRVPRRQLPHVLDRDEVERVLAQPDTTTVVGLRDRVILEVLYSTGMRRMELAGLDVFDVSFPKRTVFVRQGKGRKDRIVPIGERALAWLQKYLDDVRPALLVDPKERALLLSIDGQRIGLDTISSVARRCVRGAGIEKPGAAHLFRHAAATFMLENGADLRYIQEMLGHAEIGTTQVYTHVSIDKLQSIHAATHPGAKLERRPPEEAPEAHHRKRRRVAKVKDDGGAA
jgi:integrase/recombinase XerD